MTGSWRWWGALLAAAATVSAAGPAAPEVHLQLIRGKADGAPSGEIRKISAREFDFDVYSPALVVRTMKAEEMANAPAAIKKGFGQTEARVAFEHTLVCSGCPDGASAGASVTTSLDGREYALGVMFPGKSEDRDVYRVRIQEWPAGAASGKKDGPVGGVIPPTLLSVPVRCPRGTVGVVGFLDFKGEPLFLVLKPLATKDTK
jgi:hypothetical protein